MLNIQHAESAILVGNARFKTWWAKFTEQWHEPLMRPVVIRWWDTMGPAQKEQARAQYPTEYAEIEKKIEALRDQES